MGVGHRPFARFASSRPAQRWQRRLHGSLAAAAVTLSLGGCAVAVAVADASAAPSHLSTGGSRATVAGPGPTLVSPTTTAAPTTSSTVAPVTTTIPPTTTTTTAPNHYQPGRPVRIMFVGDSTASTTAAGLIALAPRYGATIADQGIMGCGVVTDGPYDYFGTRYPAVLPQCLLWAYAWRAAVQRVNPDVSAVMVGRWELMDRFWNGHWTQVGDPAYDAYLVSLFDQAVSIAASGGGKVALLTDPYFRRGHRPDGGLYPEDDPHRVNTMNHLLETVASHHPGVVTMVDFGGRISPHGAFVMSMFGVPVRSDGVHMTPQAGWLLGPWLIPRLEAIATAH